MQIPRCFLLTCSFPQRSLRLREALGAWGILPQPSVAAHGDGLANADLRYGQIEPKRLVFVDETGVTTALTPAYGRARGGSG